MRYMADSVDCTQIPSVVVVPGMGPRAVDLRAGYAVDSKYHGSSFACGTPDVVIDIDALHPESDVLDIEKGDATPGSAPGWVTAHNALGGFPAVLYCNRSTVTAVANACAAAGLTVGKDYRWWLATLDGTQSVADMTGVVAVQVWSANFFRQNIDLSIVYDDTWKNGGVFMALTDQQQADLHDWLYQCVTVLGHAYDKTTGADIGTRVVDIESRLAAIETALQNAPTTCQAPNLKLTTT